MFSSCVLPSCVYAYGNELCSFLSLSCTKYILPSEKFFFTDAFVSYMVVVSFEVFHVQSFELASRQGHALDKIIIIYIMMLSLTHNHVYTCMHTHTLSLKMGFVMGC